VARTVVASDGSGAESLKHRDDGGMGAVFIAFIDALGNMEKNCT
jgi:hypothetical protein